MDEYLASWQATMKFLREGRSFSGRERNCVFLNCRDKAFANVSSIAGLDFPDDGRALASVDWDQDGDLDLWFHNRTGPRLRLMCNQTNEGYGVTRHGFLALRLQGTKSNRDAIGARVEVVVTDNSGKEKTDSRNVQTLYAGDGYLSQSSKWLHFGLGERATIHHVKVRWPCGEVERFDEISAGRRYRLVEGSGQATPVEAIQQQSPLVAAEQITPKPNPTSRILLSNRLPMPILRMSDYDGSESKAIEVNERPLLINFWASWCGSCVQELKEWKSQQQRFHQAGGDVLVLSVDGLSADTPGSTSKAQTILQEMNFPFPHAVATAELMDKLSVVQRISLNQQPPFAVPTSLLLDRTGRLAAMYRGPISAEEICADISRLNVSSADWRNLSVPFQGKWSSKLPNLLLQPVANVFRDHGYLEDYENYVELDIQRRALKRKQAGSEEERKRIDEEFAVMHFNLARTLESHGNRAEATEHYRLGLKEKPDDAFAHYYLAKILIAEKQLDDAIEHLEMAIETNPGMVPAHFQLAVSFASRQKNEKSMKHFRRAIEIRPDHLEAHVNLGAMLARSGQLKLAIPHLKKAIALNPTHLQARINLGGALGASGDMRGAVEQFQKSVDIQPDSPAAHVLLAQAFLALPDEAGAAKHFQKAIDLRPGDGASMLRLSWIQSTSADANLRDGATAKSLASQVNEATGKNDPRALDALAAALAEVGDFDRAIDTATIALENLGTKNANLSAAVRQRLELYRQHRPYRELRKRIEK